MLSIRPYGKLLTITAFVVLTAFLYGCAASNAALRHRNLAVETKMSSSIFLEPVPPAKQIVYVQIRNSSDKTDFNPKAAVTAALIDAGYQVTRNPEEAHYLLQANILQVGAIDPQVKQDAMNAGFGAGLTGAIYGGAIGAAAGGEDGLLIGGLVGAALETVSSALNKTVAYSVITDLQISERLAHGKKMYQTTKTRLTQGDSASQTQELDDTSEWRRYRTRIVSTADQVNLEFATAKPVLVKGLAQSISGIFG